MRRTVVMATLAVVTTMAWSVGALFAQDTATNETVKKLVVGVKEAPPFAMKTEDGKWTGITVDLWRAVAEEATLAYEFEGVSLDELLSGLSDGSIDVGVGALTVTAERESAFDFSHPFYSSGLGIAVQRRGDSQWMQILQRVFSIEFLTVIAALALLLLGVGAAVWIFERKRNPEQFGAGRGKGLGAGFWWAAVTMTTVGYGDKAPQTVGGRIVALIWMFVSLIIIASFTASIAASLTTRELGESLLRDRPISELRVGTLAGSTAEEYARDRGSIVRTFDSVAGALRALENRQVDTVIHDAPILTYEVRRSELEVAVAETVLVRDDYAFAFPEDSQNREAINIALLSVLFEPEWATIQARYLGDSAQ